MRTIPSVLVAASLVFLFGASAYATETPIQAAPIFPDSAERIRAYFAAFGTSADPAIRADIARLRLIYDPATRDFFTPAQRQVAELMILRRDTETGKLLPISQLPTWVKERYGAIINKPSFFGHWKNFLARKDDIPAIRAEQEAMRRIILGNSSLTRAEREFALTVLTTLKDGVPPAIEKAAQAAQINKRKESMYALIEQQRLAHDAAMRVTLNPITLSPGFIPAIAPRPLMISPALPIGISGR